MKCAHVLSQVLRHRYARPANVRKAQRVSSFAYICAHRAIAMDSALNIKPRPSLPAGAREAAIAIKTSPIFRAYNRSDAPLWYRAFVAAFPLSFPLRISFLFLLDCRHRRHRLPYCSARARFINTADVINPCRC